MKHKLLYLLLIDLGLIAGTTVLAFFLRDSVLPSLNKSAEIGIYTSVTVIMAAALFLMAGAHRSVYRFANLNDYLWLSSLSVIVVIGAVIVGFLFNRLEGVARTLPVLQAILIIAALILARVLYRLFHARRSCGRRSAFANVKIENVVVVGVNAVADLYLRCVHDLARNRIRIFGIVDPTDGDLRGRRMGTYPILGAMSDLDDVLQQLSVHGVKIDRFVITIGEDAMSELDRSRLASLQADAGIALDFFADRLNLGQGHESGPEEVAGDVVGEDCPATGPVTAASKRYRVVKRLFDVVLSTSLLIVLWPLVIMTAGIVWLDVGRPLLFWQQRPGLGGRPTRVYKFRTMRSAYGSDGKRVADTHRLSAVGTFLRARRLDELPQLFNIVVGDMSFVGPRPLLPIDQPTGDNYRLHIKPGLTGWAQVMGGREISPRDKAALDRWYVDNMCFSLDVEILLRTIPMVLFGEQINAQAIRAACEAAGLSPDYPAARTLSGHDHVVE